LVLEPIMQIPTPSIPLDWVDIIVLLELIVYNNATTLLRIH
jgi:hypothetical protein